MYYVDQQKNVNKQWHVLLNIYHGNIFYSDKKKILLTCKSHHKDQQFYPFSLEYH